MKLVRYGAIGHERPGIIDGDGAVRDLSAQVHDIDGATVTPTSLARLQSLDVSALPPAPPDSRLGVPIAGIGQFIAVGLNYADHAAESNMPIPAEPIIFTKAIASLSGPYDDVMLPKDSVRSDWEVELGVVIGTTARYVDEERALDHVAGYCLVNDVSEREYQLDRGGTWDKGKGCDTFGPVGPWFVSADEVGDPQTLDLWLDVNGARMQTGNTRTMIFGVATLVSYISRFITLRPGDVITTGTPPGVGMGKQPPVYLKPGDVMSLAIAKLGQQRQRVIAWSAVPVAV